MWGFHTLYKPGTPFPVTIAVLGGKGGYFQKLPYGSKILDITSEGLGEMFEVDSADTWARKFPLMTMRGWAEGLSCADPGARLYLGGKCKFFWEITKMCIEVEWIRVNTFRAIHISSKHPFPAPRCLITCLIYTRQYIKCYLFSSLLLLCPKHIV